MSHARGARTCDTVDFEATRNLFVESHEFTFLFTDIEDSTSLWERNPSVMDGTIVRHDEILTGSIEAHGGRVVKMLGDGIYAVFGDPATGVAAAIDGMSSIESEPWPEGGHIRVRMGLHTGPATERSGDLFGPEVNRAARIGAAPHGGQIIVSAETAKHVSRTADLTLAGLGPLSIRGFETPVEVFQVDRPGQDRQFPPLRGLATPNNLPTFATSFVGRGPLRRRLLDALADPGLTTLHGPAGSGKSRLAVETAWRALGMFPDGIWFVDLAGVGEEALVGDLITSTVEVDADSTAEVADALGHTSSLVILDNCEHVIEAAADEARVLLEAPGLTLLATSQRLLRMSREREIDVPPLDTSGENASAVRLFLDRSTAQTTSRRQADQTAVRRFVERLDGLPLAIELAAAASRFMSIEDMEKRFDQLLASSRTAARDVRPQHRSLLSALDWSYNLLDDEERLALERASVFTGNFSLQSAEAVLSDDRLDATSIFGVLVSLVDRSLVRTVPTAQDGIVRFRLLQTTRRYARQKLAATDDEEPTLDRHARLFADATGDLENLLRGPDQAEWHLRLTANTSNLLSALDWLHQRRPIRALELAAQLGRLWYRRGLYDIGKRTLESALQNSAGDPSEARARALGWLAFFTDGSGDRAKARELSNEALAIARDLELPDVEAFALNGLAGYSFDEGDIKASADLWRSAVDRLDDSGSRFVTAPLFNLGFALVQLGEFEELGSVAVRLAELGAASDDTFTESMASLLLGYAAEGRSRLAESRKRALEALEGFEQVQSPVHAAEARLLLSEIAEVSGDIEEAVLQLETARDAVGEHLFESTQAHILMARIALRSGDRDRCGAHLRGGLVALRKDPNPPDSVEYIHEVARLIDQAGNHDKASKLMIACVRLTRELDLRPKPYRAAEAAELTTRATTAEEELLPLERVVEAATAALDEL